jgi:hypothetical protein
MSVPRGASQLADCALFARPIQLHAHGMPSQRITAAQADALAVKLRPMLSYLNRLLKRMEQTGFPPDDRLLGMVVVVRNAMHELTVAVHYASCPGKTGQAE